jgi:hypothetical protein
MKSRAQAAPPGPLNAEQLRQWGTEHGEVLEVISWADGSFMLVADALAALPDDLASQLYGVTTIHDRAVDGAVIAIGYVPAARVPDLLLALGEPDFDSPAPEVIAAREELEGWLRRAASQSRGVVIVWD